MEAIYVFYKYLLYTIWVARIGSFSTLAGIFSSTTEILIQLSRNSSNFKYFSFMLYAKVVMVFFNDYLFNKLFDKSRIISNIFDYKKMIFVDQVYLFISIAIGGCIYLLKPKLYIYACATMSLFLVCEIAYVAYEVSLTKIIILFISGMLFLKISLNYFTQSINHLLVSYLLTIQVTRGKSKYLPILCAILYTLLIMGLKVKKRREMLKVEST